MIEELSIEDKPNYSIEQLYDSKENISLIKEFEANEKGKGLEYYLKEAVEHDENANLARTCWLFFAQHWSLSLIIMHFFCHFFFRCSL